MAINDKRLFLACRDNDLELVELLLQWDADVNYTSSDQQTALMVACYEGHPRIVNRLLMERDIDVNKTNKMGRPALYTALAWGHTDCVRLVSQDDRLDWSKTDVVDLIFNTCVSGSLETMKVMTGSFNILVLPCYTSLVFFCVVFGLFVMMFLFKQMKNARYLKKMMKILTRLFCPPSLSDIRKKEEEKYSQTLFRACSENDLATVDLMMSLGVDVNYLDPKCKLSPLMTACMAGHERIVVRLLQDRTLNVNLSNPDGMTALHLAVERGNIHSVRALKLDQRVDWNVKDSLGRVPLRDAVFFGYTDIAKVILSVEKLDLTSHRKELLDLVAKWKDSKPLLYHIVRALVASDPEIVNKTLYAACLDNNFNTADFLLSYTANCNYVDPKRNSSCLMASCARGHVRIVERLLQCQRIDLNMRSSDGCTAVHYALYSNHVDCVRAMRSHEAVDWNVRNNAGFAPVTIAIRNKNVEMLRIILSVGDIDLKVRSPSGEESLLSFASNTKKTCPELYRIITEAVLDSYRHRNEELKGLTSNKYVPEAGNIQKVARTTRDIEPDMEMNIKKIEDLMKKNEGIQSQIMRKEEELSRLNNASEQMFCKHAKEMRRIIEGIEHETTARQETDKGVRKLRQNIETCRGNIAELNKKKKKKISTERKLSNLICQKKDFECKLDMVTCKYATSDENICKLENEKKRREDYMDKQLVNLKSCKDSLIKEITGLKISLAQSCHSVDELTRSGDFSGFHKEGRMSSLLTKLIGAKEKSIQEMEEDLSCPVCLEMAEGDIYCCPGQHLVCAHCRPQLTECPECRGRYTGPRLRHRFAEKMAAELRKLYTELEQLRTELEDFS